ncbi:unnamed protein product [Mytilus coruscus]|uniref:Uncharacterized protein n=1 Tax=Mytilus coruscus TaxID=42192 RepID=A0A6J8B930_MYTCO|nr:unnamed protein product [Mytilus coruscus]
MKFQISCRLFILLVIIINLFGLSKQDEHSANVSLCKFDIMNVDEVKRTFEDFNSMDNVWLIYIDLTLQPATFIDETKFDDKQINGLTRWTWVPRKHSYLLTYPVDLAAITFRISRNVEKQIAVSVNASFMFDKMNLQNYSMCIESLYATILENILNGNKTDWFFCNRYFEGQDYKTVLYELTGSWLGYNFACFDSIHHKVTSATFIKTGTVNIVINIFIFLLCLYFPLLFLLMPDRFNIDRDDARFYRKGEYPYSFARIILRMHDTHIQETAEISSVEEWLDQFDIKQYKPEIHVFSFLYIVTLVMYILENNFIKQKLLDLLFKIEKDWQSQRERDRDVNAEGQIERIYVHDFDRIAEKYLPFRNQIFYLILKITLTSLFLYVTFDSINQGENNKFTIAFLPTIITVALPELAEKLFSPFNIEETLKLHEDEIKSDFLEGLNNTIPKTIVSNIQADNRMERIMLVFPVVYSVFVFCCFIRNTICLRPSSFNTRPCPTTCTVCCIRINENNDHDENDEPDVMIPLR